MRIHLLFRRFATAHPTRGLLNALVIAAALAAPATDAAVLCADGEPSAAASKGKRSAGSVDPNADLLSPSEARALGDPRLQLQALIREATAHSAGTQAEQLSMLATLDDVDETRGARLPQVSLSGVASHTAYKDTETTENERASKVATLSVSGSLYDGGRQNRLTEWRWRLAEAARYSYVSTRERVVLEAVMTALERNRYRAQARVYQQYARKMACLADSLQRIVAEDRGRTSELVQARKSQRQAEISRDDALAQVRQIDTRLRKIVGNNVQPWSNIGNALLTMPSLDEVMLAAQYNPDLAVARKEASAADSYARSIDAGQRPQVNWSVSRMAGNHDIGSTVWQAGVNVNYTLFRGFSDTAASNAAAKRASAAHLREAELKAALGTQARVLRDSAESAYTRAKRYADVIRDSDLLRSYTLDQWSLLGRRSLFDLMSTESEHYQLRVAYINALHDGYLACAQLRSVGVGLVGWLAPDMALAVRR